MWCMLKSASKPSIKKTDWARSTDSVIACCTDVRLIEKGGRIVVAAANSEFAKSMDI